SSLVFCFKVLFHFVTRKCDDQQTVIDDSRQLGKPMELIIGKKFELEVWETIVQAMAIKEVASFKVDKSLLYAYPHVSKTLRDARDPDKVKRKHCCGHALQSYGLGYDDLDSLLKHPCDLEFIIEILKVENAGEYERESWQLDEKDRLKEVPLLKEKGNNLYKAGKFEEAAQLYSKAIGFLDQLMLWEKPGDKEWTELNEMKIPILLNYSQCKLTNKDYYAVIEHCTLVLKYQPDNVKALYRRAKANASVWNVDEAKADLERVAKLDPSLEPSVNSLIRQVNEALKKKDLMLKKKLTGKMF
ncbi:hypothetical protein AAG570_000124, partial [Ranatra chinensis]